MTYTAASGEEWHCEGCYAFVTDTVCNPPTTETTTEIYWDNVRDWLFADDEITIGDYE